MNINFIRTDPMANHRKYTTNAHGKSRVCTFAVHRPCKKVWRHCVLRIWCPLRRSFNREKLIFQNYKKKTFLKCLLSLVVVSDYNILMNLFRRPETTLERFPFDFLAQRSNYKNLGKSPTCNLLLKVIV